MSDVTSRLMGPGMLALVLLAATTDPAAAQDDLLVLTRGNDTIAVERVRRTGLQFEGELLVIPLRARFNYSAVITMGGVITRMENEVRRGDADPGSGPQQSATLRFEGDSVIVESRAPAGAVRTQRFKTRAGALPYMNPSFAMLEPLLLRLRLAGGDSTQVPMFMLSGGQTVDVTVMRRGPDSVLVSFGQDNVGYYKVDAQNRILGGRIPKQGLTVTRGRATGQALFMSKPDYSAPRGAPYTAADVTILTPMGHTLAGTLTVPRGKGPFPAVVTITGSGAQDRDEEIPLVKGYRPFRQLADTLARAGIALLRMDDRGFGGSGGDLATATSKDFADDIKAGLAWLRKRPEIDPRRVGLVGHSEGGLIGPLLAAEDPSLAALVIMAGPSRTGREILLFQNRYLIEHSPNLPAASRDSALQAAMRGIDSAAKASPWLQFFLDYDPKQTAARVKTPTLILQGATDQQITPNQAEELARTMRAGGNRDVTVRVFPNANHLFVEDSTGNPTEYANLASGRVRGDVVETLVAWLYARLRGTR